MFLNKHTLCTPQIYFNVLAVNGDRTRDLQIFSLTLSELGNEWLKIIVAYIGFRKYRFMEFFMFAGDHEQLFQLFVGFGCLFHSWSWTLFETCYISMTSLSHKIISIWFDSWSEVTGEQIYIRSYLHLFSSCVIHKLDIG